MILLFISSLHYFIHLSIRFSNINRNIHRANIPLEARDVIKTLGLNNKKSTMNFEKHLGDFSSITLYLSKSKGILRGGEMATGHIVRYYIIVIGPAGDVLCGKAVGWLTPFPGVRAGACPCSALSVFVQCT